MSAPPGNRKVVAIAVVGALIFASLPFISKEVNHYFLEVLPCNIILNGIAVTAYNLQNKASQGTKTDQ